MAGRRNPLTGAAQWLSVELLRERRAAPRHGVACPGGLRSGPGRVGFGQDAYPPGACKHAPTARPQALRPAPVDSQATLVDATAQLRASLDKKPLLVGLAFAAQELPFIPREDHDVPLDAVVTETGVRFFGRAE